MKKIIFDLDNTLLFMSSEWTDGYQRFIDKYNLPLTPEGLFKGIGVIDSTLDGVITRTVFCNFMKENVISTFTDEMLDTFLEEYAKIPLLKTDMVYDVLDYLSKKYELVVYTSWFTDNQIKRLKRYNLDKFFSEIYGWDILPKKPSVEAIKSIVKDNIDDYIFVGDSIPYDMEVPASMGMDVIFYNRKGIEQDKYKEISDITELKEIL